MTCDSFYRSYQVATHLQRMPLATDSCQYDPDRVWENVDMASLGGVLLLGTRMLLGAPGLTTRSKKLLGAKGIATRSKDATRGSWPDY